MKRGMNKWALLALIFGVMVVADQASKFLAVDRLTWAFSRVGATTLADRIEAFYTMKHLEAAARPPHVVWKPMWRMTYAENPGAAWGMLRDLPDGFRHGFFVLVSLVAVGFMLWYYRKLRPDQRWMQVAIAFVLSGAVAGLARNQHELRRLRRKRGAGSAGKKKRQFKKRLISTGGFHEAPVLPRWASSRREWRR